MIDTPEMGADFPVLAVYGDFIRAAVDKAEAKVTGGKPVSEPVWMIWGDEPATGSVSQKTNQAAQ